MVKLLTGIFFLLLLNGCASHNQTLYSELGGKQKVEEIVNNFVTEIEYDPVILPYFEGSDIDRFRAKLEEQICMVSGGGFSYTGDTMEQVHAGMNITETHFNHTVDLLINAMDKSGVPHPLQNRLLAELAKMRGQMLYR